MNALENGENEIIGGIKTYMDNIESRAWAVLPWVLVPKKVRDASDRFLALIEGVCVCARGAMFTFPSFCDTLGVASRTW